MRPPLTTTTELIAYGRNWAQIAENIDADEVIFQDLKDLKDACIEAAEGTSQVKDFEVGVFCGEYKTEVPEGYFEHLRQLRRGKKKGGLANQFLVGNSGPVNTAAHPQPAAATEGMKSPENREDIRYVMPDGPGKLTTSLLECDGSLYNIANEPEGR